MCCGGGLLRARAPLLKQVQQIVNVNVFIHNNVSNTWSGAVLACSDRDIDPAESFAEAGKVLSRDHAARWRTAHSSSSHCVGPDGVGLVFVPDHGIEVAVAVEVAEGD